MSFNELGDDPEFAAAAAATAFVISTLEPDEENQRDGTKTQGSLLNIRSWIVDIVAAVTNLGEAMKNSAVMSDEQKGRDSENYKNFDTANAKSNDEKPEKSILRVPSEKRTPTTPRRRLSFADQLTENPPQTSVGRISNKKKPLTKDEEQFENEGRIKPPQRTRSVKKIPTFGVDGLEDAKRMKPDIPATKPSLPSHISPPSIPPLIIHPAVPANDAQRTRTRTIEADAWEAMGKIQERYEKLNAAILDWEEKKRKKANHKLEMTEYEPERRKAKAMQDYQIAMEQIKQIANEARAQLKEKQRNDELKTEEKANRQRMIGEPPPPPVCHCL